MTNTEKIQANNAELRECIEIAENLPNAGGGGSSGGNKLAQVIDKTVTEITAEDLQGVTTIGYNALVNCSKLTSVTIPNSVTSIGNGAFAYCTGLASVTIGNGVTSIGAFAFEECSKLTSITIPNGVTSISNSAFAYCTGLASVTIPNSVTSIGQSTFAYCTGLASVTIPNSVTSIGQSTFNACTAMQYYDFTACTSVPTLKNVNAFTGIPSTCEIRVPASLVDEWKNATNWTTYADKIVGV